MNIEGRVQSGLEGVHEAFARNFDEYGDVGASFAVFANGECVVDLWGGFRDPGKSIPWTKDTLANVWSTTKGAAAMCIAKLVQDGKLNYGEKVSEYWPEFAAKGKQNVTVAQLMSHQSGLCGLRRPISVEAFYDHDEIARELAAQEPLWTPGAFSGYHAITYGFLAGELVRRVTNKSLGAYFHEEFAVPQDIDFYIGLPESEEHRVAKMIASPNTSANLQDTVNTDIKKAALANPPMSPDYPNDRAWRKSEIPGAGGQGSAYGVAKLYGLLAHAAHGNGKSPLNAEGLRAMTQKQIENEDAVLGLEVRWGAGVLLNNLGAYGPNESAFGHSGWGGSFGAFDPATGLGMGYVMNQMGDNLAGDPRAMALLQAVYDAL